MREVCHLIYFSPSLKNLWGRYFLYYKQKLHPSGKTARNWTERIHIWFLRFLHVSSRHPYWDCFLLTCLPRDRKHFSPLQYPCSCTTTWIFMNVAPSRARKLNVPLISDEFHTDASWWWSWLMLTAFGKCEGCLTHLIINVNTLNCESFYTY